MCKMLNNPNGGGREDKGNDFPLAGKHIHRIRVRPSFQKRYDQNGFILKHGIPQQDLFYLYVLALLQKPKTQGHGGCMCAIYIYRLIYLIDRPIYYKHLHINKW